MPTIRFYNLYKIASLHRQSVLFQEHVKRIESQYNWNNNYLQYKHQKPLNRLRENTTKHRTKLEQPSGVMCYECKGINPCLIVKVCKTNKICSWNIII